MAKVREPFAYFKSLVSLTLIILCLIAAQWQYQRGVDRHARNAIIEKHIALAPTSLDSVKDSPLAAEWQSVTTQGVFDPTKQILLKNRYSEGFYGFEVLTLFTTPNNEKFWVDRGWVKAGAAATIAPTITPPPTTPVSITGRLRLDSSLPRGSFFALPADGSGLISKLDAQSQLDTQDYYIDLLSGSESSLTPAVPAQLPELSDGPHMAYALQWLFFGGLVIYGRILIRRTR
jgi:cytochrome oxidase assembly protein ShyY1